ncbi:MAG: SpoIVB peptidase [Syntrophomonadaceae bacterium]|nr:SpoIVB peptidase [Syntrophomonadaceae bacterium]
MGKMRPVLGIILSVLFLAICFLPQTQAILSLPCHQKIVVGESKEISFNLPDKIADNIEMQIMSHSESVFAAPQDPPVVVHRNASGYEITALKPGEVDIELKILGCIPIKSIAVQSMPTRRVVAGGHSIGVLLQSRGVMVVGFAPVTVENGEKKYPARDQGIRIGDLITEVNGNVLTGEDELAKLVDGSKGKEIILTVKRQEKELTIPVQAAYCPETQRYRIGLYVRDGIVGVGTLTFWEPETKRFAALGHLIIDADTKQGIELLKGKIVSASIHTVKPAKPGKPGEKIGVLDYDGQIKGEITKNTYYGIYGKTYADIKNPDSDYTVEVGYSHQVKEGKAQIYTVVNGNDIEKFDIIIEKVYPERKNGKGMVIRINDPRLLNLTGGIVQGMSGSPIIQDAKIVGAVTHVFLNDPTRGYGIFMDNMLAEMPLVENELKKISTNY